MVKDIYIYFLFIYMFYCNVFCIWGCKKYICRKVFKNVIHILACWLYCLAQMRLLQWQTGLLCEGFPRVTSIIYVLTIVRKWVNWGLCLHVTECIMVDGWLLWLMVWLVEFTDTIGKQRLIKLFYVMLQLLLNTKCSDCSICFAISLIVLFPLK